MMILKSILNLEQRIHFPTHVGWRSNRPLGTEAKPVKDLDTSPCDKYYTIDNVILPLHSISEDLFVRELVYIDLPETRQHLLAQSMLVIAVPLYLICSHAFILIHTLHCANLVGLNSLLPLFYQTV